MKKLLWLGACLWGLAGAAHAQAREPALVVVRIHDAGATVDAAVTRGEGRTEKVTFASGNSDKNLRRSGEGYYKLFQQLYQEGYALQSTFSSAEGQYTTLLFVKKP